MSREILDLFDRWNESLQTLNPENVVDNYADDAVLVPTLSNKICKDKRAMKEYFRNFLKMQPSGEINDGVVQEFDDWAIHSGIYTFSFGSPQAEQKEVMARFSFSYKKYEGTWKIVGHHSSLMPEAG